MSNSQPTKRSALPVSEELATARKLPCWMNDGSMKIPRKLFSGDIVYCYDAQQCSSICDKIMSEHSGQVVCGFDTEWEIWPCNQPTGLIQICFNEKKCYLFQIAHMNGIPVGLKRLMTATRVIKAGVFVSGDFQKLHRDYKFDAAPFIIKHSLVELQDLATQVLKVNERWSLAGLASHLFRIELNKDRKIRCGRWNAKPLSHEQKIYAATDAYVSLVIYEELKRRQDEKEAMIDEQLATAATI